RRGTDEGVDAAAARRLDGLGAAVDVLEMGAGETGNDGVLRPARYLEHRLEIAFGRDRETGFDHVDAHLDEDVGNLEFLLEGHCRARTLLAVAQRGIENYDALGAGGGGRHRILPSGIAPGRAGVRFVFQAVQVP